MCSSDLTLPHTVFNTHPPHLPYPTLYSPPPHTHTLYPTLYSTPQVLRTKTYALESIAYDPTRNILYELGGLQATAAHLLATNGGAVFDTTAAAAAATAYAGQAAGVGVGGATQPPQQLQQQYTTAFPAGPGAVQAGGAINVGAASDTTSGALPA